ncbi:unnamed protein product [Clonostachys rhizophaga]|uniref:Uncharacterized protein n=1 Tax=Clonostachys rhizophaga TaxID=160324 RepID=A0A9N9VN57_9HYPO|nr:unnamed protein product [Clonostachys rhizophaga]
MASAGAYPQQALAPLLPLAHTAVEFSEALIPSARARLLRAELSETFSVIPVPARTAARYAGTLAGANRAP